MISEDLRLLRLFLLSAVVSEVSLGGSFNVRQFSRRQLHVKYSVIKRGEKSRRRQTRRGRLPSHVFASFPLFSLTFSFVPVCVSKKKEKKKRKKGDGFVSVQQLSMIHVSSALICELQRSPRINHFRLSKQFPITVSIFRFLYDGARRGASHANAALSARRGGVGGLEGPDSIH